MDVIGGATFHCRAGRDRHARRLDVVHRRALPETASLLDGAAAVIIRAAAWIRHAMPSWVRPSRLAPIQVLEADPAPLGNSTGIPAFALKLVNYSARRY